MRGGQRFWQRGALRGAATAAGAAAADPHAFLLGTAPAALPLVGRSASAEDADDEVDEEGEGEAEATDSALVLRAAAKLAAGVALCAVFSDPLVGALGRLSDATGVPPFFVGCVSWAAHLFDAGIIALLQATPLFLHRIRRPPQSVRAA